MSGIIGMNDWERHWKLTREHIERLQQEQESEFTPCTACDGHDACWDFGCAIEQGININQERKN